MHLARVCSQERWRIVRHRKVLAAASGSGPVSPRHRPSIDGFATTAFYLFIDIISRGG